MVSVSALSEKTYFDYRIIPTLNVVDCGNLTPPLLFPLLSPDRPCCWLLLELFYPIPLCCLAPVFEPTEWLVLLAYDIIGAVCLEHEVEFFPQKTCCFDINFIYISVLKKKCWIRLSITIPIYTLYVMIYEMRSGSERTNVDSYLFKSQ